MFFWTRPSTDFVKQLSRTLHQSEQWCWTSSSPLWLKWFLWTSLSRSPWRWVSYTPLLEIYQDHLWWATNFFVRVLVWILFVCLQVAQQLCFYFWTHLVYYIRSYSWGSMMIWFCHITSIWCSKISLWWSMASPWVLLWIQFGGKGRLDVASWPHTPSLHKRENWACELRGNRCGQLILLPWPSD